MQTKRYLAILIFLIPVVFAQLQEESGDYAYGVKLYEQGFYELAESQFSRYLGQYPKSGFAADAAFYRGLCLYQLQDFEGAADAFKNMAVSFPQAAKALEAWLYVGECEQRLGRPQAAAKSYLNVQLLNPASELAPRAVFLSAEASLTGNDIATAENAARTIIERYPNSAFYLRAGVLLGQIYSRKNHLDLAVKWLQNARQSAARLDAKYLTIAYRELAIVYNKMGKNDLAIELYDQLYNSTKSDSLKNYAMLEKASLQLKMRQIEQAGQLLQELNRKSFISPANQQKYHLLQMQKYLLVDDFENAYKVAQNILDYRNGRFLAYYAYTLKALQKNTTLLELTQKYHTGKDQSSIFHQFILLDGIYASIAANVDGGQSLYDLYRTTYGADHLMANVLSRFLLDFRTPNTQWELWSRRWLALYPRHRNADELAFKQAAFVADDQLRSSAMKMVLKTYPNGDFPDSAMTRARLANTHDAFRQRLTSELLAFQLKQLEAVNKVDLYPELARIYFNLGQFEQASAIIAAVSTDQISPLAQREYHLIAGQLAQRKYSSESGNLKPLLDAQAHYKAVVATQQMDAVNQLASERLVEVTLALLPDSTEFAEKTTQLYGALIKRFADDPKVPDWHLHVAQTQINMFDKGAEPDAESVLSHLNAVRLSASGSEQKARATLLLGQYFSLAGQQDLALKYLLETIDQFPHSAWQHQAILLALKLDNSDKAKLLRLLIEQYGYANASWKALKELPLENWPANAYAYFEEQIVDLALDDPVLLSRLRQQSENAEILGDLYAQKGANNKSYQYYMYAYRTGSRAHSGVVIKLAEAAAKNGQQAFAAVLLRELAGAAVTPDLKNQYLLSEMELYYYNNLFVPLNEVTEKIDFSKLGKKQQEKFLKMGYEGYLKGNKKAFADKFFAEHKNRFVNSSELAAASSLALGDYYLTQNKYDKANSAFKNARKNGRGTQLEDDAVFKIAVVQARLNRLENAFEQLSEFMDDYPDSDRRAEAYMTLAGMYYRSEKIDEALNAYDKAREQAPNLIIWNMASSNVIKIAFDMGLFNKASTYARDYLERNPGADDLVGKKIIIGKSYARMNQVELAIQYLKALRLQVSPDDEPEVQFAIAEIYYFSGAYETAIVEFLKIPVMSKNTELQWGASAFYYAGQSYEKLGKKQDAIRMYNEIIKRPGIISDLKKAARDKIKAISG
jgi:TolA-binding protein